MKVLGRNNTLHSSWVSKQVRNLNQNCVSSENFSSTQHHFKTQSFWVQDKWWSWYKWPCPTMPIVLINDGTSSQELTSVLTLSWVSFKTWEVRAYFQKFCWRSAAFFFAKTRIAWSNTCFALSNQWSSGSHMLSLPWLQWNSSVVLGYGIGTSWGLEPRRLSNGSR